MTSPELEDKPVRIIGEHKTSWSSGGRRGNSCTRHDDNATARNKDTAQVCNRGIESCVVEVTSVLLIHVATIGHAESPPTSGKDSDAAEGLNWIVVEGIRRL